MHFVLSFAVLAAFTTLACNATPSRFVHQARRDSNRVDQHWTQNPIHVRDDTFHVEARDDGLYLFDRDDEPLTRIVAREPVVCTERSNIEQCIGIVHAKHCGKVMEIINQPPPLPPKDRRH